MNIVSPYPTENASLALAVENKDGSECKGDITCSGSIIFKEWQTYGLSAVAQSGYKFSHWEVELGIEENGKVEPLPTDYVENINDHIVYAFSNPFTMAPYGPLVDRIVVCFVKTPIKKKEQILRYSVKAVFEKA